MYLVRIHSTVGTCREFIVNSRNYANQRIAFYQKEWKFFKFATLAEFVGYWIELPID